MALSQLHAHLFFLVKKAALLDLPHVWMAKKKQNKGKRVGDLKRTENKPMTQHVSCKLEAAAGVLCPETQQ